MTIKASTSTALGAALSLALAALAFKYAGHAALAVVLATAGLVILLVLIVGAVLPGPKYPRIPKRFKLIRYRQGAFPSEDHPHEATLVLKPRRRLLLRLRACCSAPVYSATANYEVVEDGCLAEGTVFEPECSGNSAIWDYGGPRVDPRGELLIAVRSPAPIDIEKIELISGRPVPTRLGWDSLEFFRDFAPYAVNKDGRIRLDSKP